MDYPHHDTYAELYARYLKPERTAELLDLLGPLDGLKVLDLCGGGGRASFGALDRGALHVTLVDESAAMTAKVTPNERLTVLNHAVDKALELADIGFRWDAAVCQQAVNYWLTSRTARALAAALRPGAVFVFNTFWDAPDFFPVPKHYSLGGKRFMELSWRSGPEDIEHVQVCEGEAAHTTAFRWIAPESFQAWLGAAFVVEEHRDGKTSVYRCTRKA